MCVTNVCSINSSYKMKFFVCVLALFSCLWVSAQSLPKSSSEYDFNFGWKFALQNDDKAATQKYIDAQWQDVRLPHDWSVSFPFDSTKEGATGYLDGGMGWYRKHFKNVAEQDQQTFILFDGIYNNATVYINGKKLGFHPYGYSPFFFDISPYLNKSGDNVVAVKVDRTRYSDSRWYTGSGIYRNVKLVVKDKLSIPIWGTYITTPKVSEKEAVVQLIVKVQNDHKQKKDFVLETEIFDAKGDKVAQKAEPLTLKSGSKQELTQTLPVQNPQFWDIDNPVLYQAVHTLKQNGKIINRYTSRFGIRTIKFNPATGFYLNGKNHKIKGVCLHHDGGLVGAAVPKEVWRRRLQKLKDAGCNALRMSHNPASDEMLDLCDEMGFLVQEEFFDEWDNPKDKRLNMNERSVDYITRGYTEHFQEWAETDLKTTMLRDRNHPSIFQWSIGNEIEWTYPRYAKATGYFEPHWGGNYFWSKPPLSPQEMLKRFNEIKPDKYELAKTAQKLSRWTKELDTTRPVVANTILPAISHISGYGDALDIVGYSYGQILYDYGHQLYPDKVIMGTESLGQWHEWKKVLERPHISGTFYWTGIDYMGEVNKKWPTKATASGLLDVAGFEKPSYQMMRALWKNKPHVYIVTQTLNKSLNKIDSATGEIVPKNKDAWKKYLWFWNPVNHHWNYKIGELVSVEVYSNCPTVELFLNGKSLGIKKLASFEDHVYKWAVPFAQGTLEARAITNGNETASETLTTAQQPATFNVASDKSTLKADLYDAAHITVQLVDKNGNPVYHTNQKVRFTIEGPAKMLGVDNGAPNNVQPYQANQVLTSEGRCLMIVQATDKPGDIVIKVSGENLKEQQIKLEAVKQPDVVLRKN